MNRILFGFLCLSLLFTTSLLGQVNFKEERIKNDPVHPDSTYTTEEKKTLHLDFLQKAKKDNDLLKQVFGNIYLYYDCLDAKDFTGAGKYILDAEAVASRSNNKKWQGWARHRRGALHVYLRNFEEALRLYSESAELCKLAGDSLCLAFNYEQIGSMHGQLKNFDEAEKYFDRALPLLESFAGKGPSAVAMSNYGSALTYQDRQKEAIPYFEKAIAVQRELGDAYREVQAMHNLGQAYLTLGQYGRALGTFRECMNLNLQNNRPERLLYNYHGIYQACEQLENYQEALVYAKKYYKLKDSIIGAKTQLQIAELETKYENKQKELELEKSRADLTEARRSIERISALLLFILLLVGIGIWRWKTQSRRSKMEWTQNQENLNQLTKILIKKNAQLSSLEEEISILNKIEARPQDFEQNLYSQKILTTEDWNAFKVYFEKSYPGLLSKIRDAFPALTEAEERLFLFIKLNLTRKEAASILGITSDTVKKTRYRLRKKLELDEGVSLDDFVRSF